MTNEEILRRAKDALDKAIEQKKINVELLRSIGPVVVDALKPVLDEIAKNARIPKQELADAISKIVIQAPKAVEMKIPDIKVPAPEVTVNVPDFPKIPKPEVTVNVPPIKIPDLQWPKENMPIEGWVQLMGVDARHPLPVQLRDANGNPVNLLENLTTIIGGGGGGGARIMKIGGFSQSAYSELTNPDGRLRVSVETGGSGLTDAELRASGVEVHQVSGANWSVSVTNALTSTVSVGDQLHDAADDGGAPIKIGGIARQTNQTAVGDGDRVSASFDDLGRQIVRHQVRDLTQSAYATLTTGTETTLLAGVASTFLDLLWIVGANNSDAAVSVDIRSGTAGSTLLTLQIPANGTAGISASSPLKQEVVAGTWTADMADITGTTVSLSALFSKEI